MQILVPLVFAVFCVLLTWLAGDGNTKHGSF